MRNYYINGRYFFSLFPGSVLFSWILMVIFYNSRWNVFFLYQFMSTSTTQELPCKLVYQREIRGEIIGQKGNQKSIQEKRFGVKYRPFRIMMFISFLLKKFWLMSLSRRKILRILKSRTIRYPNHLSVILLLT
jgi:hypothetical protein